MRAWAFLIGLAAIQPAAAQPAEPGWVADVVGHYAGKILNAGQTECHATDFTLKDGRLVGHYRIEDTDPFEGELTDFVPEAENAGPFTWTDRFGVGKEFVIFGIDHGSFSGAWGVQSINPSNPVWGLRGGTVGCAGAVS